MMPTKWARILIAAAVILQTVVTVAAQQGMPQQHPSIQNFLRIDEQICTGGQPSAEDLAKLKAEGVKAIINLRQPSEYNFEEEAARTRELGLRYFHIPVNAAEPKDEQVDEFLKVTANPQNRPAFIHCRTANRVGAFWMIRRVLVDGWKIEDAEAEGKKIGLHSPNLIEFARGYLERHAKPK
jgi:uncharacterized protein (TIGR01244 family)